MTSEILAQKTATSIRDRQKPKGVITALATPLKETGELDVYSLRRLVERQLHAKVDAVFVLGSVGEGPMLSHEYRAEVIRETCQVVQNTLPIYCGVMDNATELILRKLETAYKNGANAGVFTLPFYGRLCDQAAIHDFFAQVARRTPLPLIVYNLPKVTNVDLNIDDIIFLTSLPEVVGLKDTRDDLNQMIQVASDKRRMDILSYLPGNSSFASVLLTAGADGLVSVFGNIFPELMVALYRSHTQKNVSLRDVCSDIVKTLTPILRHPSTAGGIKCALEIQGVGTCRTVHPWPSATKTDRIKIEKILTETATRMSELGII